MWREGRRRRSRRERKLTHIVIPAERTHSHTPFITPCYRCDDREEAEEGSAGMGGRQVGRGVDVGVVVVGDGGVQMKALGSQIRGSVDNPPPPAPPAHPTCF